MGCYVNPPNESKEAFLQREGTRVSVSAAAITEASLPVCLVDNGMFKAAGVAYSEGELQAFADPDGRPKQWFQVPREKLLEVSDLADYL